MVLPARSGKKLILSIVRSGSLWNLRWRHFWEKCPKFHCRQDHVIGIPSKVWKEASMTIKQFMIFATVSRHLNITRASQELHISQPSVSQHLKLLEEDYNVKLFKKSKRGIVLTGSGNLFLTKLMPILTQLDELKRAFSNESTVSQVDSLVIGGTYGPSSLLLP